MSTNESAPEPTAGEITATREGVAAVFEEWLRRYDADPEAFAEEYGEPETYGGGCADYFLRLNAEIGTYAADAKPRDQFALDADLTIYWPRVRPYWEDVTPDADDASTEASEGLTDTEREYVRSLVIRECRHDGRTGRDWCCATCHALAARIARGDA